MAKNHGAGKAKVMGPTNARAWPSWVPWLLALVGWAAATGLLYSVVELQGELRTAVKHAVAAEAMTEEMFQQSQRLSAEQAGLIRLQQEEMQRLKDRLRRLERERGPQ